MVAGLKLIWTDTSPVICRNPRSDKGAISAMNLFPPLTLTLFPLMHGHQTTARVTEIDGDGKTEGKRGLTYLVCRCIVRMNTSKGFKFDKARLA